LSEEKNNGSNDHTRVSVRLGDFEVNLEGKHSNIEALMGKRLFDFIKGLQEVTEEVLPIAEKQKKEEPKPSEEGGPTEYPPPLGKPANLSEALSKLMVDTGWGNKPRSLGEIMTALETNAIYYKKAAVATVLVALVKKGTLRRLGSRGNFAYVVA
jgi:hypothetical protein